MVNHKQATQTAAGPAARPAARPTVREPGGRQAAYTARNRAALVSAAQQVLADFGVEGTVEQLVAQAQVSPATIYNYFGSKEALLTEALSQMWMEWLLEAYDGKKPGESFDDMIDVCRKLFRVQKSHPLFAQVLNKTLKDPSFIFAAVGGNALSTLRDAAGPGGLAMSYYDKRVSLFRHSLAGLMQDIHVTQELAPAEADVSLAIALSLWNVSPAEASRITSRPLSS
jgi:AcrR family transcriptional regulator